MTAIGDLDRAAPLVTATHASRGLSADRVAPLVLGAVALAVALLTVTPWPVGVFQDEQGRPPGLSWYYVRAIQDDGELAWASPMWVHTR